MQGNPQNNHLKAISVVAEYTLNKVSDVAQAYQKNSNSLNDPLFKSAVIVVAASWLPFIVAVTGGIYMFGSDKIRANMLDVLGLTRRFEAEECIENAVGIYQDTSLEYDSESGFGSGGTDTDAAEKLNSSLQAIEAHKQNNVLMTAKQFAIRNKGSVVGAILVTMVPTVMLLIAGAALVGNVVTYSTIRKENGSAVLENLQNVKDVVKDKTLSCALTGLLLASMYSGGILCLSLAIAMQGMHKATPAAQEYLEEFERGVLGGGRLGLFEGPDIDGGGRLGLPKRR